MNALLSLLPIYIFGNLHCAGMCGPLVMLLAKHPHRWAYFFGRLFSFTLMGFISAEAGVAFFAMLSHYRISAAFSILFGTWIFLLGFCLFFKIRLPGSAWIAKRGARLSALLSRLMLSRSFYAVFLFGACTLLLPCGQTIIVFSIISLNCTPFTGLLNGFAFALLTSPALVVAMHASHLFSKQRQSYHLWMGGATLFVGFLAVLRGLADLDLIKHFILNPTSSSQYHIVFF